MQRMATDLAYGASLLALHTVPHTPLFGGSYRQTAAEIKDPKYTASAQPPQRLLMYAESIAMSAGSFFH